MLYFQNINVIHNIVTGDDLEYLKWSIENSFETVDLIIMTGGLGPTDDDKTVEVIQSIFEVDKYVDEFSRKNIEHRFLTAERGVTEDDFKMAEIPYGSAIIKNDFGLAPGFIIENNNKTLIAMPGVPDEMIPMVDNHVTSYLIEKYKLVQRDYYSVKVAGVKESELNRKLKTDEYIDKKLTTGITMM